MVLLTCSVSTGVSLAPKASIIAQEVRIEVHVAPSVALWSRRGFVDLETVRRADVGALCVAVDRELVESGRARGPRERQRASAGSLFQNLRAEHESDGNSAARNAWRALPVARICVND
jgi:hypothetical protein